VTQRWRACLSTTVLVALACLLGGAQARAARIDLVVHAGRPAAETRAAFTPLARYVSAMTGEELRLVVPENVLAHWKASQAPRGPELVLDDGHFADYRVKRFGFAVLAKVAGLTGFSVVTGPETVLIEPEELYGERVATLPPPSLSALRLAELFPDSVRAPVLVEVSSYAQGIRSVVAGRAAAAVIPSRLVRKHPQLNVVMSTERGPGMALSASPALERGSREALRRAFLTADASPAGRRALARAGLEGFEPATAALYDGHARLLRGTWGY